MPPFVENAVRIAAHLGIPLFESTSNQFDVVFVRVGSQGAIGVNRNVYWARRRFSVTHEIGHAVLNHPPVNACYGEGAGPKRPRIYDREADSFAAELLMPRLFLSREWFRYSDDALAKRYHVSNQAMEIRLRELGFLRE